MRIELKVLVAIAIAFSAGGVLAETYKCSRGGQTLYSDLPCASGAARADASTDAVSKDQKRQAEQVHLSNKRQLSELEYQAARDRYAPAKVYVLPR